MTGTTRAGCTSLTKQLMLLALFVTVAFLGATTAASARTTSGGVIPFVVLEDKANGPTIQAYSDYGGYCHNNVDAHVTTSPHPLYSYFDTPTCQLELYRTASQAWGYFRRRWGSGNWIYFTWTWGSTFSAQGTTWVDGSQRRFSLWGELVEMPGSPTLYEGSLKYSISGSPPPRNESEPYLTGNPVVGETLTVNPGTWSGDEPQTYAYEWRRCNTPNNCSRIWDAVGESYTLEATEVDSYIEVNVVAANDVGTGVAATPFYGPVQAAP